MGQLTQGRRSPFKGQDPPSDVRNCGERDLILIACNGFFLNHWSLELNRSVRPHKIMRKWGREFVPRLISFREQPRTDKTPVCGVLR